MCPVLLWYFAKIHINYVVSTNHPHHLLVSRHTQFSTKCRKVYKKVRTKHPTAKSQKSPKTVFKSKKKIPNYQPVSVHTWVVLKQLLGGPKGPTGRMNMQKLGTTEMPDHGRQEASAYSGGLVRRTS